MRKSLLGVVMLWEMDFLEFLKKVSGVQIFSTILLFKRKISVGPSNLSLSSTHIWRKNMSMVYSWCKSTTNQHMQNWLPTLLQVPALGWNVCVEHKEDFSHVAEGEER